MRKFNDIAISAILCGMVIALFMASFAPVCLADMESEAKREFERLSAVKIADPDALDQFIKKYPNTKQAQMAFVYRYALLAQTPTIEDYNQFIEQYSDKDIAPIAIYEVYNLYKDQNRASGYFDFIKRYPGSQQALVAMERLQQLLFEYVCLLNTEEDYDSFISFFPDSEQVTVAKIKAGKLAGDREEKEFEAFQKRNPKPSREEIEEFVTTRIVDFEREVNLFTTKYPNISNDTISEDRTDMMIRLIKIQRRSLALQRVYHRFPLTSSVQRTINELKILTRLDAIFNAIERNHKELLKKLDEETDRICDGLAQLHQDNREIIDTLREGFKSLHQDLINIHNDLKEINMQLVKVNVNLEQIRRDVNANFDRLDKKLDVINQNLINVHKAVTEGSLATNQLLREEFSSMNKTIETGFGRQAVMLNRMNESMVNGFNETNKRLFGIGQQIDRLDNNMMAGFKRIDSSLGVIGGKLDNIDHNMKAGFSALSQQLDVLDNHMIAGFSEVGQRIDNMDAHMQAGMSALNNNMNAMRQEMGQGFNRVCNTVCAAAESVNQSLSVIHDDINAVNSNVIAGNQRIENMHKDMVEGFRIQANFSRAILHENQIQNAKLDEIKEVAYSGFNDLSSKMDSQIAMQQSTNTLLQQQMAMQESRAAQSGDSNGSSSSGSSLLDKATSVIGTVSAIGEFLPKIPGIVKNAKKVWKSINPFSSVERFEYYAIEEFSSQMENESGIESLVATFHEKAYRVHFAAYDDVDAEAQETLMKMVFQEDKRSVLYAAMKLASFKRPYPVFPKILEDLVLDARNPDELQEAILPLAVYCGVTPEALLFAAQYIF